MKCGLRYDSKCTKACTEPLHSSQLITPWLHAQHSQGHVIILPGAIPPMKNMPALPEPLPQVQPASCPRPVHCLQTKNRTMPLP